MADEPKRLARKREKKGKTSDIEKQIALLMSTGKVMLGTRRTTKELMLGDVKAVIYADNIPERTQEDLQHYAQLANVKLIKYEGSSLQLGKLCGKLHPVSLIAVKDFGEAKF